MEERNIEECLDFMDQRGMIITCILSLLHIFVYFLFVSYHCIICIYIFLIIIVTYERDVHPLESRTQSEDDLLSLIGKF